MPIFIDRSWTSDVKTVAQNINRSIKKQDFIQTKLLIDKLIQMRKDGAKTVIRQDAGIALDYIVQEFGKEKPTDFLSEDWKGDFKSIRKRLAILFQTRNRLELKLLIERMNAVINTNKDSSVRSQSLQILLDIANFDLKLIDPFEQKYLRLILKEKDKSMQKLLNELLVRIDASNYYGDYEKTLEKLTHREKILDVKVTYDFSNDFIRYKVKILNNTDEILWDMNYRINLYEKNFVIRKISPDYTVYEENVVYLSVLRPGDMKEVIISIEPRSPQVYLEGMVNYKKEDENDFYAIPAQDLMVDIIEYLPKMVKLENKVSVSHIREFFDFHVKYKSSNVFALPDSITSKLAYTIGKQILTQLHLILSLDVMDEDSFFGEALFYGKTKKEEETVVILRSSAENKSLEITVGTNNNSHLVAMQIKFDTQLRQIITTRPEFQANDKLFELRCPNCLSNYDKWRDWCPWCGESISIDKLLS
jgi:Zn finger protein HypA/HybF involved in hydrogenase expression